MATCPAWFGNVYERTDDPSLGVHCHTPQGGADSRLLHMSAANRARRHAFSLRSTSTKVQVSVVWSRDLDSAALPSILFCRVQDRTLMSSIVHTVRTSARDVHLAYARLCLYILAHLGTHADFNPPSLTMYILLSQC